MSEELKITVVDGGGSGAGGSSGTGGVPSRVPSVPKPPPFPTPPPIPGQPPGSGGGGSFSGNVALGVNIGQALTQGKIGSSIKMIGAASTKAAGAIKAGGAAIATTLGAAAGPIGIAIAALTAATIAGAFAVKKFAEVVRGQVAALAGLSADVALAQAQTEIRRFESQFRRANELGPSLARAEDMRGQFEEQLYDLGTSILKVLLQVYETFEPAIALALETFKTLNDLINDWILPAVKWILDNAWVLGPAWWGLIKILKAIQKNTDKEEELEKDPFAQEFMDLLPRNTFWPGDQKFPAKPQAVGV